MDLIQEGLMFVGHDSSELHKHGRFYTKYVSEIESDPVGDFTLCRQALANLGLDQVSDEDCSAVRYVCECVSRRAGFMVSAGITALLKKMDYKDVVVAIDGNLIEPKRCPIKFSKGFLAKIFVKSPFKTCWDSGHRFFN